MRKIASLLMLLVFMMLLVTGCGGYNPFEGLNVSEENVPKYALASEVKSSKDEQSMVYVLVEKNNLKEEQAKKILADYINKQKDNYDVIIMHVKTKDAKYTAEYNKTAEAYEASPTMEKLNKPKEFPALFYTKDK